MANLESGSIQPNYVCPLCRQPVLLEQARYRCLACGRNYAIHFGIPDFRTFDPPYVSISGDVAEAGRLAERFDELDFAGMVRWKYVSTDLAPDLLEKYTRFRLQNVQRGRQRVETMRQAIDRAGRSWPQGAALDLGCGVGGMVVAMAPHMQRVVGADIFLVDLILAKRLLADHGIQATLVCCCAEFLPFPDDTFGLINSNDTIEHVQDQSRMVAEAVRVLARWGCLTLDTPNRYALFTPEPHVNLRWVGFLPRQLQAPYVWWRRKTHYQEIRLLSMGELNRLVADATPGTRHVLLYRPLIDVTRAPRSLRGRWLRRVPWLEGPLNALLKNFIFNYDVVVWKDAQAVPGAKQILPL